MSKIIELINSIFGIKEEENIVLDDRFEFRLNRQEKQLIKKYCNLKHISASEFFRSLALNEIDNFIKSERWIFMRKTKKCQHKKRIWY